jgi:hypothetical protein
MFLLYNLKFNKKVFYNQMSIKFLLLLLCIFTNNLIGFNILNELLLIPFYKIVCNPSENSTTLWWLGIGGIGITITCILINCLYLGQIITLKAKIQTLELANSKLKHFMDTVDTRSQVKSEALEFDIEMKNGQIQSLLISVRDTEKKLKQVLDELTFIKKDLPENTSLMTKLVENEEILNKYLDMIDYNKSKNAEIKELQSQKIIDDHLYKMFIEEKNKEIIELKKYIVNEALKLKILKKDLQDLNLNIDINLGPDSLLLEEYLNDLNIFEYEKDLNIYLQNYIEEENKLYKINLDDSLPTDLSDNFGTGKIFISNIYKEIFTKFKNFYTNYILSQFKNDSSVIINITKQIFSIFEIEELNSLTPPTPPTPSTALIVHPNPLTPIKLLTTAPFPIYRINYNIVEEENTPIKVFEYHLEKQSKYLKLEYTEKK